MACTAWGSFQHTLPGTLQPGAPYHLVRFTDALLGAAGLASVEDTECIVAKAIRDGGIDATLDHAARTMSSRETADVYATPEPAAAFHARVAFCLDIHNEARDTIYVLCSEGAGLLMLFH